MAGKTRVKLKGDRSNGTWLTGYVSNSPFVEDALKERVTEVKRRAEAKMKSRYPKFGGWHFGTRRLGGKWGSTYLMWPMSPMARASKNSDVKNLAVRGSKFQTTGLVRSKRKIKKVK
jgi:hypothetical protein